MRRLIYCFIMIFAFSLCASVCLTTQTQRIASLKPGESVTIKARVGQRVESEEKSGGYAFTIRDDFGDMILGRTSKDISNLHFGATYNLKGVVKEEGGRRYLQVDSWSTAYAFPIIYIVIPIVLLFLIVGVVVVRLVRGGGGAPPAAWDYAEIISGPDQGKMFALRGKSVVVGRKQDPDTCVSIVLDTHVSRQHGVLSHEGSATYYEDTGSTCGSWVEEEQVASGQKVVVPPGGILRLGPHTTIRVGKAQSDSGDLSQTRTFDDAQSAANWGESPTKASTGGPES